MAEVKFPTEVVDLPSRGILYPKESVLSSGKLEIKYMTAREEDILTSVNLIKKGLVIDKLLDSLIVDESVKVDDLLLGDKNAILIASRILGYGKEYQIEIEGETVNIDLTALKDKKIDTALISDGNKFEFNLPTSKRKITFKLLTSGDEKVIGKEIEGYKKIDSDIGRELTTRLKHQMLSVDENSERSYINNFVDNEFLSRDTRAFREYVKTITPDVDMSATYTNSVGEEKEFTVPMTVQFLWPA